METSKMLAERRSRILQSLIREYTATAAPVSSGAVLKNSGLKVSSATIRNEMAHLEEEGYIMQPHTSAGRVPSSKGYRYYVEILLEEQELPQEEKRLILHQFSQTGKEAEAWTHLAATILSRMLQNVAVVTPPQFVESRLKVVKLISLSDFMALLVLVFEDASFRQKQISFEGITSQEDLNIIAQRFSDDYVGLNRLDIKAMQSTLTPLASMVLQNVIQLMDEDNAAGAGTPYFDGLSQILSQPEFTRSDRALLLMELLEERNFINAILSHAPGDEGMRVIIGEESSESALNGLSVVLSRYGHPSQAGGVIGVLGPNRMPYERVFSAVRFLSGTMSEILYETQR